MTKKYARFNLQLEPTDELTALLPQFQQYLHDAAIEGLAEEFEIFYYDQEALIGVSILCDSDDPMSLLEAGSVLGYCLRRYEEYRGEFQVKHTWLSLHDAYEKTEDSVLPYPK